MSEKEFSDKQTEKYIRRIFDETFFLFGEQEPSLSVPVNADEAENDWHFPEGFAYSLIGANKMTAMTGNGGAKMFYLELKRQLVESGVEEHHARMLAAKSIIIHDVGDNHKSGTIDQLITQHKN